MRTKPSNNTRNVHRELERARRLMRHKCTFPGGECCPACADLFRRRGRVGVSEEEATTTPEAAE